MKKMVESVLSEYVGCTGCMKEVTVVEAFDTVRRCWPLKNWIQFECTECGEKNLMEIKCGSVSEGFIDGTPAPCFISKRTLSIDDLSVKRKGEKLVVKALNMHWEFQG